MRPKAGHSRTPSGRSTHAAKASQACSALLGRRGRRPAHARWRRPTGRTSGPESQANDPYRNRSNYSEKQCHPASRWLREHQPKEQTTMPRTQQFSKFSSVGVLKPCCITTRDLTARSATKPRSSWSIGQRHTARADRDTPYSKAHRRMPMPTINLTPVERGVLFVLMAEGRPLTGC